MAQTETRSRHRAGAPHSAAREPLTCVAEWQLVELVAEGSWANIYRARPASASADQPAAHAVKVLRADRANDVDAAAALAREALVGRRVSHPHLVPVLEAHVTRPPRYLVMPWLEGATLDARLGCVCSPAFRRQSAESPPGGGTTNQMRTVPLITPIEAPTAVWIARQVAEALDALDAAGWMHGDIKPSNVFISPEGHVTLLDLGFARRRDEAAPMTNHSIMGTFHYLAPECLMPSAVPDIRSDIYSLGAMLYRMLAGRLPFEDNDLAELAVQHKQSAPPSLRSLAPHLPGPLVALVHQMLAKDPLRRPQTPREAVDRLVGLEISTFTERAA